MSAPKIAQIGGRAFFSKTAEERHLAALKKAARIKIDLEKYRAADKIANGHRKVLASELGVTLEAVRKFERSRGIAPTRKKRLAKNL